MVLAGTKGHPAFMHAQANLPVKPERRAPLFGLLLALAGLCWLASMPWPDRHRPPVSPLVGLVYTAIVLTLLLSVRSRSILASVYRLPLCGYLALGLFAVVAALKVGHWPWYGNPDPKDLGWPLLTVPAALIVFTGLLAVPIGAVALLVTMARLKLADAPAASWQTLKAHATWLGVGLGLWILDIVRDGGLLAWIMD
jgi:hypothetical protein